MRASSPRNIFESVLLVDRVIPRSPVGRVVRSCDTVQGDGREAIVRVRAREQTIEGEVAGRSDQVVRNDVDTVPVVIECNFVEQPGTDDVGCVDCGAVRGVPKHIRDGGNVVIAPLRGSVSLRNLFGNPVPEDTELAVECMVDSRDLFSQVRRGVVPALEKRAAVGLWEYSAVFAAGGQQGQCVGADHASRNRVIGERLAGYYPCRRNTAGAVSELNRTWHC